MLAEQLEVAARELELVVGDLGVGPHLLLAQLDQQVTELALAVGEHPLRIPLVAQSPEGLATPCLLGHQTLRSLYAQICSIQFYLSG